MKSILTVLLLTITAVGHATDATELIVNRELRNQIKDKERELTDNQEQNRALSRQRKNLEQSIARMDTVLNNIKNPSAATKTTAATTATISGETIVGIGFNTENELAQFGYKKLPVWAVLVPAGDGGKALKIEVADLTGKKTHCISIWLPIKKIAGRKLLCTVKVKGENISPAQGCNTSKFNLMVKDTKKVLWPDAAIGTGSFDWKEVKFSPDIPFDAQSCMLMLGLQGVTGKIYFRDLKISILEE